MADYTAEQMRERYIHWMGADLGTFFYQLTQEAALLHMKWNEYVDLFGSSEEQIVMLNTAAPGFFWLVEEAWWDDLLLHIARLTDSRPDVLTVKRLQKLVKVALRDEVATLIESVDAATAFAVDWRNRRIAHYNIDIALSRPAEPLSPASRDAVRVSLQALDDLMHFVEKPYMNTERTFYDPLRIRGGSDSIVDIVRRGLLHRNREFELPPPGTPFTKWPRRE